MWGSCTLLSLDPPRWTPRTAVDPEWVPPQSTIYAKVLGQGMYVYIYMCPPIWIAKQSVPCIWPDLGKASPTPSHGVTFVPLREVGHPRPRKHRCHCMLASCLQCIKLTVRDHRPLDMLNLLPAWATVNTICWFAEKEWFLTGKSRAQTLVKTLPSAYGAGNQPSHNPKLLYGRLACKWWQMSQ